MDTLTFQPVLGPFVLTIVFVLALLMLFVGPSFSKLTKSRRLTLSFLRFGVIMLALLATLRPGCIEKVEKNQAAILLFLIDVSRSMELPHIADDSTRWATTLEMLRQNESRFQQLSENKIDVKFFGFDNQTKPIDVVDGIIQIPEKPDGGETDIGTPLYETSIDVRDQRLLAVFLASDGNQNVPEPEIELSQAADSLRDMEVPLLAVQLGLADDAGQLADVAITNFAEQLVVNKNNDLIATATMVTRGFVNQDVNVELVVTDSAGTERIVASEIYRPTNGFEETNVELKYRPTEPGEYRIKVRAVRMPEEKAIRNNELDGFLTVRDEGMRVLFLHGSLGNEQKFLRQSLPALEFIELDFHPIYTYANARDQNWPMAKFEADFRDPKKYDVFILCNVDSSALTSDSWDALAEAVGNGKGLLMLGGTHSFGPGRFHETALADVLPIKMNSNERQDYDQDIRRELHINSPFKLRPTSNDYLTNISDDEASRQVWNKLPDLVGANRITVKETATVYLESDDDAKRPILAGSSLGGRVLVFAGDTTWRWLRYGFEKEFNRFWRQIVLWLANWDSRNDGSVSIELPKRRFSAKSRVQFGVAVKSIDGEMVEDVSFESQLTLPNGEQQMITINRIGDQYQAELDPDSLAQAGVYRIRVAAQRDDGSSIGEAEREFVVMDRDKEKSNPMANPELMKRLANQTSEFGGRVMAPNELSEILDQYIENPPMTKIEIPTKRRLGESFADASLYMALFVGLLGTEWWLRKKWGLV